MKEAPITHSPHAFVPKREMTEEERRYLYRFRLDESFNPYTVIDSLRKVYHRDFSNDLLTYIGTHPDEFSRKSVDWHVSRTWVDSLKIIRPESIFFQALRDVKVDIFVDTKIKLEEVRSGNEKIRNQYSLHQKLRLRYSFNLIPCCLDCRFLGVILDERDSLLANNPSGITLDKYLLPYIKDSDRLYMTMLINPEEYDIQLCNAVLEEEGYGRLFPQSRSDVNQ